MIKTKLIICILVMSSLISCKCCEVDNEIQPIEITLHSKGITLKKLPKNYIKTVIDDKGKILSQNIILRSSMPSFLNSSQIEKMINDKFDIETETGGIHYQYAIAINAYDVRVNIPKEYQSNVEKFIALVESLRISLKPKRRKSKPLGAKLSPDSINVMICNQGFDIISVPEKYLDITYDSKGRIKKQAFTIHVLNTDFVSAASVANNINWNYFDTVNGKRVQARYAEATSDNDIRVTIPEEWANDVVFFILRIEGTQYKPE